MLAGDTTRAVTGAVIRVDAGYGVLEGGPSSRA
jgi:enoyl-[acyl-carrier-protein] reductase (NADH)